MDFLMGIFALIVVLAFIVWLYLGLILFTDIGDGFYRLYRKDKLKFFVAFVAIGPIGWICFTFSLLLKYTDKLQEWLEE